jgi:hypothetical protein
MNFGASIEEIPSRGGPPEMISSSGTEDFEKSGRQPSRTTHRGWRGQASSPVKF